MDEHRFDDLTRALRGVPSRRHMLGGVIGILGLSAPRFSGLTESKRKRKQRKGKGKKAKPNEYGCLEVGDPCQSASQCCSGICKGKKGKRTCRAHGTGTCEQGEPGYCESGIPIACDNSTNCLCYRTTAGSKFCADNRSEAGGDCADCAKDADCAALGFPPGSACVPGLLGGCAGVCESGMFCAPPCSGTMPGDAE